MGIIGHSSHTQDGHIQVGGAGWEEAKSRQNGRPPNTTDVESNSLSLEEAASPGGSRRLGGWVQFCQVGNLAKNPFRWHEQLRQGQGGHRM